jgi:TRAP-type C4-dicarboxylate transport system permease large subunit
MRFAFARLPGGLIVVGFFVLVRFHVVANGEKQHYDNSKENYVAQVKVAHWLLLIFDFLIE